MTYNLIWKDHAVKELDNLDKLAIRRIVDKIDDLIINPSLCDFKSLKGHHSLFRLRVGHYRVIFEHDDRDLTILKVGNRQNIYEGF